MAHFTGNFDWEKGVLWDIAFQGEETEEESGQAPIVTCLGLVDTGATITCISPDILHRLNLPSRGKMEMRNADEVIEKNLYFLSLAAVFGSMEGERDGPPQVSFDLLVATFNPGNSPYQALIGRDILHQGLLVLSPDGDFHFSY